MFDDLQKHEEGIFGWHEGAIRKLEYVIEADRNVTVRIDNGKGRAIHYSVPSQKYGIPTEASGQAAEMPGRGKHRPRRGLFWRAILAILGLLLFAAMGYLLGMLILDLHIKLPLPLQNLLHGR